MQLTPDSWLDWAALVSGDFVIDQLVPFHFCARVAWLSLSLVDWPTAVQKLLLVQLTAFS